MMTLGSLSNWFEAATPPITGCWPGCGVLSTISVSGFFFCETVVNCLESSWYVWLSNFLESRKPKKSLLKELFEISFLGCALCVRSDQYV